jgi:hypothetical protein
MFEATREGLWLVTARLGPILVGLFVAGLAFAQTRKPAGAGPKTPTAVHSSVKSARPPTDAGVPGAVSVPVAGPSPPATTGAGLVAAKPVDGGTQVFKFSQLDIEGRLKSPQLVYFLRRVRAEFAAGDLGHRSFLREMSETRKESSF